MPHLEEGTIHELLDGELSGAEAAEVAGHVEACPECAARLAEARLFMAEADRLIAGLDTRTAQATPVAPAGPPLPDLEIPTERTDRRVLMPAPPARGWRRRARPQRWAWAAMLVLVAGGGYMVLGRGEGEPEATTTSAVALERPAPVASELEASGARPTAAAPREQPFSDSAARPETTQLAQRADAPAEAAATDEAAPSSDDSERQARAAEAREREAREREARRVELAAAPVPRPPAPAATKQSAETTGGGAPMSGRIGAGSDRRLADIAAMEPGVVRGQANEAASARSRPADSLLVATPPPAPAAASAPPRPSIDLMAQSQIALRIGLDEAKRELGGNLHVIDGLQPEFVGLVPGRLVPGADTGAYVVRVVYLDDEQRTIFLDQQRIRRRPGSGGGPVARLEAREDSSRSAWTAGNVRLSLKGSLPKDSLARLARKVR